MRNRYTEDYTLLPDLILSRKLTIENIEYFPDTCSMSPYRNQLRFAAAMANVGDGPLEILGNGEWRCGQVLGNRTEPCPDGNYPKQQVSQRLYTLGRDSLLIESKPGGYMYYDTQPGHNHFHADHWVRYSLLKKKWWRNNPKKWKVISTSDKVSYCLYDNMVCTEENKYCTYNDDLYSKHNLKNYGFGNFTACNSQKQGISVGGIDYYGKFYEGQSLFIPPDIKCGTYYLLIEIDPENYYKEINEDNNAELFKIEIKEDKDGVKYLN